MADDEGEGAVGGGRGGGEREFMDSNIPSAAQGHTRTRKRDEVRDEGVG